jgi:hypothetical protein
MARDRRCCGACLFATLLLATLAGCVTTYEDAPLLLAKPEPVPLAVPVAITLPQPAQGTGDHVFSEFYGGIMQRMREAAADHDVAHLEFLLEGYDRRDLPPYWHEQMRGYRAIAKGLRFEQHAIEHARLSLVPAAPAAAPPNATPSATPITQPNATPNVAPAVPPCGEKLLFELVVPPGGPEFVLGGRGDADPTGFSVAVTIEDAFVDGSSRSSRTEDFLWLPATLRLAGDHELRLPVAIDADAGGSIQRTIHLRVDLMPGYVLVDGVRAPVQRRGIAACTLTQWPRGYEKLQEAPLKALEQALRTFDEPRFPIVYLAAALTKGEDREKAITLLIEKVRFARAEQAQVAMAALRAVSGETYPVGDRDAWLAWWQTRR